MTSMDLLLCDGAGGGNRLAWSRSSLARSPVKDPLPLSASRAVESDRGRVRYSVHMTDCDCTTLLASSVPLLLLSWRYKDRLTSAVSDPINLRSLAFSNVSLD